MMKYGVFKIGLTIQIEPVDPQEEKPEEPEKRGECDLRNVISIVDYLKEKAKRSYPAA